VVALCTSRSKSANRLVSSSPTLVFYAGEPPRDALRKERLPEEALHSAIRSAGVVDARSVAAVVLESDGTLSVLRSGGPGEAAAALERSAIWNEPLSAKRSPNPRADEARSRCRLET
jgi:uncharacterized membrane protein YcaP (DUF421 family)